MAIELTPQQKDILIRTALGEARGEGVEGMADVLQVIFNRAQSGQYPNDPAAVALQPYQFSTWNKGEGGNNPQQFKPSDPIYRKAEQALEMVASGQRPDYTGGALFYHTPAVNPNWSKQVNKFGTVQRNGHIFYPSRPVPPGEIPNVVASQLDTTPQTRNVPRPQPRPAQRMVQGTGQAPTSAASRAVPTMNATPRLAPQGDGIFAYSPPDMQPAQITPGMGSLTPDFFRPQPQVRLPTLPPRNASPAGPGPVSMASVQDMYGRPQQPRRMDPIGEGPVSLASVQDMYGPSGIGRPPATRVAPSTPVSGPANGVGQMPEFAQFLSQFGPIAKSVPGPNAPPKNEARLMPGMRDVAAITSVPPQRGMPIQVVPAVATQMATARPVVGFPTPANQRPAQMQQRAVGFPTPANIRPSMAMAQPPAPTMRVTVQGANSYTAPQPQSFAGTSSGRSYTAGQSYTMGGDTYVANPDGSFTNTRTGRRLAGSSGSNQSSGPRDYSPAQSLV